MNDISVLQKQLEYHKKKLNDLNDSIKNLDGIDSCDDIKHKQIINSRLKKRKLSDKFDDDDDFDSKKVSLQSSIVNQSANIIKSKEELIKIQNKDSCSEQRNKRFLGVILGTLKKFKSEDCLQANSEKAQHRKEIEEKIEIKKNEEKRKMIEEKQKIEDEKCKNIQKIELIEEKIHLMECLNLSTERYMIFKKFIITNSKPPIFFLPKKIDKINIHLIDEARKRLDHEYNEKKSTLENQLKVMDKEIQDICQNSSTENEIKSENDHNSQLEFDYDLIDDKSNILKLGDEIEDNFNTEMSFVDRNIENSNVLIQKN